MVLTIVTDGGFDFGIATESDDRVIMAQLPQNQLDQLRNSPFTDAIALLGGNDYFENDDTGRIVFGNAGNDTIFGGAGNDTISGGRDNDYIDGRGGDNILFGNLGDDTVIGGSGNDTIFGGQGNDVIIGGPGNDVLSGDRGLDTLTGGGGANQFFLQASGANRDVITDFQPGVDKLRLPDGVAFAELQIRGSGTNTEIVRNGEVLAILNGVAPGSVTANDFIGNVGETPPVAVTPGNTARTAGDLGVFSGTRTFRDFVGTTDSNDYYRFTLNQVHDVELTLFGMDQNADLELYIGDLKPDGSVEIGNRVERSTNWGTSDDSITRSLGAGTYFVRVYPQSNQTDTRYSLTFEATPTGIIDQAGNTPSEALNLGILEGERNFQDFVGTADPNDYYRFTLAGVRDFNLDLFGMRQNADIELYLGQQKLDGSWELGNRIERSTNWGTSDDSITRSLGAGTYFVRVYPQSNQTDTRYSLRFNATP
ncbi:peptidase S8/S53 subtilisin kexin sedolisin [Phormidium yuhuli AB48]|uniref:Peptidase S8/S53 subtilisin kexin sedolisin n=1 Tax=Phormidium yuhuli AB48 TaxID=2940671 RepID=A0ABY5ALM6_9CYAN|nr:calcium-binding protein [Phormidium yuhuli]USR90109.1 peptidase S8/S53 subtilisin kexin sedolisin [Phormidium yuhuli AB48]